MSAPKKALPDQVKRLLIVFVVLVGGFVAARIALPQHLKSPTVHVKTTVEREKAKPVHYAGSAACADCHDESEAKKTGYHRDLSCETCHGPAHEHAEDPTEVKPVPPKTRDFCAHCHTYDPSRPTGFPQINPVAHNPLKSCSECHNPHDPKPPTVPGECQACHGEIARTKAVSAHALLECTTCHEAPEEHKVTPHAVRASKPAGRDFCDRCHDEGAEHEKAPKIDSATHGEKYLCWQCHYPHLPEVD